MLVRLQVNYVYTCRKFARQICVLLHPNYYGIKCQGRKIMFVTQGKVRSSSTMGQGWAGAAGAGDVWYTMRVPRYVSRGGVSPRFSVWFEYCYTPTWTGWLQLGVCNIPILDCE